MQNSKIKREKRLVRRKRIRAKVAGTAARPRLSIFRSSRHIGAQLIDDSARKTLVAASDLGEKGKLSKTKRAARVGKDLAEAAGKKNVKEVVFDRGGFIYTGRVRALAEEARKAGLKF